MTMRNPNPNTTGLTPFTPERAREAARLSAQKRAGGEELRQVNIKLTVVQHDAVKASGDNLSALVRRLLDEHLKHA